MLAARTSVNSRGTVRTVRGEGRWGAGDGAGPASQRSEDDVAPVAPVFGPELDVCSQRGSST